MLYLARTWLSQYCFLNDFGENVKNDAEWESIRRQKECYLLWLQTRTILIVFFHFFTRICFVFLNTLPKHSHVLR